MQKQKPSRYNQFLMVLSLAAKPKKTLARIACLCLLLFVESGAKKQGRAKAGAHNASSFLASFIFPSTLDGLKENTGTDVTI